MSSLHPHNFYKHNFPWYFMIKKEKSLLLVVGLFLIIFLGVGGVLAAASGVNLGITGTIGDYASEVTLITNTNAGTGIDAYDMPAPSAPDPYSSFYSTVSSSSLAIDSWGEADRTGIALTYDMPDGESGNVVFTWDDISGSTYTATMTITGDVTGLDMVADSDNTYTYSAGDSSDIYVTINIGTPASAVVGDDDSGSGGGGGGGGGGATPAKGQDIFIKNKFMDVFIGTDVIEGVGLVKNRKIDIFNEASEPISVQLSIPDSLKDILVIDDSEFSFILGAGQRKIINARLIAPVEAGIYEGYLFIKGKTGTQSIAIKVVATSEELWFDAILEVDEPSIDPGEDVSITLNLEPEGLEVGFDVNTEYTIYKLENGEKIPTGITVSKEFFVDGDYKDSLTLSTSSLEPGDYIIELTLTYPNEIATSRASFSVRGGEGVGLLALFNNKMIVLILAIGAGVLVLLIILTLFTHKKTKRKKKKK